MKSVKDMFGHMSDVGIVVFTAIIMALIQTALLWIVASVATQHLNPFNWGYIGAIVVSVWIYTNAVIARIGMDRIKDIRDTERRRN